MGNPTLQTTTIALLLLVAVSAPSDGQTQNGVVLLHPNETMIIEGPLLGGQSKRFADFRKEKKQHIAIKLNSQGGAVNEANLMIGAKQASQRKGGTIKAEVPKHRVLVHMSADLRLWRPASCRW